MDDETRRGTPLTTFNYRLYTVEEMKALEVFQKLAVINGDGKTPTEVLNDLVQQYIDSHLPKFTPVSYDQLNAALEKYFMSLSKVTALKWREDGTFRRGEAWWSDGTNVVYNLELCVTLTRQRLGGRRRRG
jgi:hypothetical protein